MKKVFLLMMAALLSVGAVMAQNNGRIGQFDGSKRVPSQLATVKGLHLPTQTTRTVAINTPKDGTPISLPYTCGFETDVEVGAWTLIDNDNDGFNWEQNTAWEAHGGSACMVTASYDNDSYTALTPENWMISPELVIPAGGAMMTWWVAPQDANYPAEHYKVVVSTTAGTTPAAFSATALFEETILTDGWQGRSVTLPAGNIRVAFVHCDCTDNFFLKIDDVTVFATTGANYTITTAANPANGGTVTGGGSHSEGSFVTLTAEPAEGYYFVDWSTGETANPLTVQALSDMTITANFAELPSCHYTLPYSYGFEDEIVNQFCWSTYDGNEDGSEWILDASGENADFTHSGDGFAFSTSLFLGIIPLEPIDYLISPEIEIPEGGATITWWAGSMQGVNETFQVKVSPTGSADPDDFTETIFDGQAVSDDNWIQMAATITTQGTVRIAFVHTDGATGYLFIDDIDIVAGTTEFTITVQSDNEQMGTVSGSGTYAAGAPVTITATPNEGYLFVRWNDDNTQNPRTVTAAGDATYTAYFMEEPDCHFTLPYSESFEDAITANYCWQSIDADADGYGWMTQTAWGAANGTATTMASASYINNIGELYPDNWLVSPEIEVPEGGATLSWWVGASDDNDFAEHYSVMLSTTAGTSTADFTETLFTETLNGRAMKKHSVNIDATGTVRIAFRHYDCTNMYWLLIDEISVTAGQTAGINGVDENAEVIATEYYDVLGRRLSSAPAHGVYLIRTITTQGISTRKAMKL